MGYRNVKMAPGKLYCWENSDYEIEIVKVSDGKARVMGLLTTNEPIQTDDNGNEFVKLGWQTYYAYAKA